MSAKKGNPRAIKMRLLAEAWAKDIDQELAFEDADVEPMMQAMRDALDRQLGRAPANARH